MNDDGWIYTALTLPEPGVDVYVSYIFFGDSLTAIGWYSESSELWYYSDHGVPMPYKVYAWKPLTPAPYPPNLTERKD